MGFVCVSLTPVRFTLWLSTSVNSPSISSYFKGRIRRPLSPSGLSLPIRTNAFSLHSSSHILKLPQVVNFGLICLISEIWTTSRRQAVWRIGCSWVVPWIFPRLSLGVETTCVAPVGNSGLMSPGALLCQRCSLASQLSLGSDNAVVGWGGSVQVIRRPDPGLGGRGQPGVRPQTSLWNAVSS